MSMDRRGAAAGQDIRRMLADACPPLEMAAAAVAPARGPMRLVEGYELLAGGTRRRAGAHWQAVDVFDRMCRDAWLRHRRAGGDVAGFADPFSAGQICVGRDYRGLVERHEAGGMRCASLETAGRAAGTGGEFIDAFIAEGREIELLRRRIGAGQALRRIRPSKRGSKAVITDRALVDLVCLWGLDLSAVLRRHGWAVYGANRAAARAALGAALDRMQGYRD